MTHRKYFSPNFIDSLQLFSLFLSYYSIPFISNSKVYHPVRIASLRNRLKKMSVSCTTWAYYANKNKIKLGYKNSYGIIANGYCSQIRSLFINFKRAKFKSVFISLVCIIFGMPVITVSLLKSRPISN